MLLLDGGGLVDVDGVADSPIRQQRNRTLPIAVELFDIRTAFKVGPLPIERPQESRAARHANQAQPFQKRKRRSLESAASRQVRPILMVEFILRKGAVTV